MINIVVIINPKIIPPHPAMIPTPIFLNLTNRPPIAIPKRIITATIIHST